MLASVPFALQLYGINNTTEMLIEPILRSLTTVRVLCGHIGCEPDMNSAYTEPLGLEPSIPSLKPSKARGRARLRRASGFELGL